MAARPTAGESFWTTISSSFSESIGDVVFGMEDGAVSIAGLVFGVAFSVHSTLPVILAGASGAAAAAISMAAGAYLDVQSQKAIAQQQIQHERREVDSNRSSELQEERYRFRRIGFRPTAVHDFLQALQSTPGALDKFEEAFEVQAEKQARVNPYLHAFWMFLADLVAAATPVLPFFFFPLETARIVAIVAASILLFLVGIGRGIIANWNIWVTAFETLGIAAAAALGGIIVGQIITGSIQL
jgi:VIT1/CCC1 family predicted Fe2+/Mn2+ transporter